VLVCECGYADCAEKTSMTVEEYEKLRANSAHFAIVHGHDIPDVERRRRT
jgi:hypothetical protein